MALTTNITVFCLVFILCLIRGTFGDASDTTGVGIGPSKDPNKPFCRSTVYGSCIPHDPEVPGVYKSGVGTGPSKDPNKPFCRSTVYGSCIPHEPEVPGVYKSGVGTGPSEDPNKPFCRRTVYGSCIPHDPEVPGVYKSGPTRGEPSPPAYKETGSIYNRRGGRKTGRSHVYERNRDEPTKP